MVGARCSPFCPIDIEMSVLWSSRSTVGRSDKAAAKLCVHLVQLSQRLGIQIDIDRVQPNGYNIVYAHFNRGVSSLRFVGRKALEKLGE